MLIVMFVERELLMLMAFIIAKEAMYIEADMICVRDVCQAKKDECIYSLIFL
jgi:hypothetical protein